MNILNLYFSSTGNTEKVALRIEKTTRDLNLHRMMASLMPGETAPPLEPHASARIFEHKLGNPGRQG